VSTDGFDGQSREIPRAQDQLFNQPGSAASKYSALVVGRPGWLALLKYELVVAVSQAVPGALGLLLRKLLYPLLLKSCGRNVTFGQNVVLRHPHKIAIGDDVVIDDHCLLDAKGTTNTGITIGSGVFIGRGSILSSKNGDIVLGERANVGFYCEIFSASHVTVGSDALIAAYAYLVGGDHRVSDRERAVLDQGRKSEGIGIGSGAWIGAGAVVLDGVTVGARAIVGANAVVRADVPDGGTAVGVPARLVPSGSAATDLS
jgi:acetyltransferase-like isoleucine patch superfamily enzyme